MTLAERMQAKFGKDLPMKGSIFSGKQGLTAKQHEGLRQGPGFKRARDETSIFKELNDMQN